MIYVVDMLLLVCSTQQKRISPLPHTVWLYSYAALEMQRGRSRCAARPIECLLVYGKGLTAMDGGEGGGGIGGWGVYGAAYLLALGVLATLLVLGCRPGVG